MFRTSEKNTDEELGPWLNAFSNASCFNLHHNLPEHVTIGSPVSRVFSASDSSAYFSNRFHFPGYKSSDSAPFQDIKHQVPENYDSTRLKLDSDSCGYQSPFSSPFHENWVHDLRLSEGFYRMNITEERGNCAKTKNYEMGSYRFGFDTCSVRANIPCYTEACTLYKGILNEVPSHEGTCGVSPSPMDDMKWALPALGKGCTFGTSVEPFLANDECSTSYLGSSLNRNQTYHLMEQRKKQGSTSYDGEVHLQKPYITTPYGFIGSQISVMDYEVGRSVENPLNFSQSTQPKLALNVSYPAHCCPPRERTRASANNQHPQFLSPNRAGVDSMASQCDNSSILQGREIKYHIVDGCNSLKGCTKNSHNDLAIRIDEENVSEHNCCTPGGQESNGNIACDFRLQLLLNFYSLGQVQGFIYSLAKDQNSCRFLQRMVDKGTGEDMKIVFEGIRDNVVELMMDPTGNYLVQKLLDACREEQKLQIVFMVTKEPGQLVRISLNAHGTRVVQKLIETLNTVKQISLVKSALEPGILDLVKDLNGNHVIQRCLQCFSCRDNEFIFNAAAKFCVDIATHQHGCCVLQRCIDHAMGKYRGKLVAEICRHGLLLAQDPFGNYVVQYIIEMKIPAASANLRSQFKGNYVNLSTQKFSSHVVEKCLKHVGESRQRIVQELLSASNFEQLLQDPFANYVIQSALAVTKGSLHALLVEAVRPYKILRTSPYCKRIFSGSLLKK